MVEDKQIKEIKAEIAKIKKAGKTATIENKPALVKELESAETRLTELQKTKVKAKAQSQGINDFAKEYVKTKGSGLTLQGKAQRKIKGLAKALTTRKWIVDSKDSLTFTKAFKDRKFNVQIDQAGEKAALTTGGKVVNFPLGKGAFKSVDYVLTAYGHRYMSEKQVYEDVTSVVIFNKV